MRLRTRASLGVIGAALALALGAVPVSGAEEPGSGPTGASPVHPGEIDVNGSKTDPGGGAPPDMPKDKDKPETFSPEPGAVYEWSTEAPGPDKKRRSTNSSKESTLSAAAVTDEGIPYAGWAACGAFDDRFKVVHDYARLTVHPRQERTYARLYCGLFEDDGATTRFGYRHILDRHSGDWQNKANYINRNWRDLAGWAMDYTFKDPGAIYIQPERFCYQRMFYLYYGNTQVSTMRAIMYLGETGVRIMTAFPVNSATCNGTKIWG